MGLIVLWPLIWGCGSEEEGPVWVRSCPATGQPIVEVSYDGGDYQANPGAMQVAASPAPQGGPPYSEFRLRARGLERNGGPTQVRMQVFDGEALLSEVTYPQRFICSNTGDNDDYLVASPFHVRYPDREPEELAGERFRFQFTLTDPEEREVVVEFLADVVEHPE